ncbi:unnamed protein product [Vitrella brassicaformis CCMP3155]|uniref:Protein arginine methyltransferase 10 n=1 Tax=Vitrella brassicaformis (strain CCMP3155) TaxID=1169540 RepID=A0A0G4ENN5_VITBC|nr:unnamed protein product [Vitrella brassicaformis CCMP3155]|eukprot:CEL98468.1 unnamed protein product [Vitrella brassicaformis CCMP3155]
MWQTLVVTVAVLCLSLGGGQEHDLSLHEKGRRNAMIRRRHLQMDESAIGEIHIKSEYKIDGNAVSEDEKSLIAGAPFSVSIENKDTGTYNWTTTMALTFADASKTCEQGALSLTPAEGSSTDRRPALIAYDAPWAKGNKRLPPALSEMKGYEGKIKGASSIFGYATCTIDGDYCVLGQATEVAGSAPTEDFSTVHEMAIPFPGFYKLCMCLGNSCGQIRENYNVDLGKTVQVAGFRRSPSFDVVYCAAHYKCRLSFDITTSAAGNSVLTDVTTFHNTANGGVSRGDDTTHVDQASADMTGDKVTWTFTTGDLAATDNILEQPVEIDATSVSVSPLAGHFLCWLPYATYPIGIIADVKSPPDGLFKFPAAMLAIAGPKVPNSKMDQTVTVGTALKIPTTYDSRDFVLYQQGDQLLLVRKTDENSECGPSNNGGVITFRTTSIWSGDPPGPALPLLTSENPTEPEWHVKIPAGNFGLQGEYLLCWCPGADISGAMCDETSEQPKDYLYEAGTLLVPGPRIATGGVVCYPGSRCSITIDAADFPGHTDESVRGKVISVVRRNIWEYDGDASKIVYHELNCGASDTHESIGYLFDPFPKDVTVEYGNSGRHVLCWNGVQPASDFDMIHGDNDTETPTLAASHIFTVYGPSRENFMACKKMDKSSTCTITQEEWTTASTPSSIDHTKLLAVGIAENDLLIGVRNDGLMSQSPWATSCGEEGVSKASNSFEFTIREDTGKLVFDVDTADLDPGVYELCYCPLKMCINTACIDAQKETNRDDCTADEHFKASAGIMVVEGPSKEGLPKEDGNYFYEAAANEPFSVILRGYGLGGNSGHKLRIVEGSSCMADMTASGLVYSYPEGSSAGTLTSEDVLGPPLPATYVSHNGSEVTLSLPATKETLEAGGIETGGFVSFAKSLQSGSPATITSEATYTPDELFRTWSTSPTKTTETVLGRTFYKVVGGPRDVSGGAAEIDIQTYDAFPSIYADVNRPTWDPTQHQIQAASAEMYAFIYTDAISTELSICWTGDSTANDNKWHKWATLRVTGPRAFDTAPTMFFGTPEKGKAGPLVLSFTPSGSESDDVKLGDGMKSTAYIYKTHQMGKSFRVRVRFPSSDKFFPVLTNPWSSGDATPYTDVANLRGTMNAAQANCGKVFYEMWTADGDGFPLPARCWVESAGNTLGSGPSKTVDVIMELSKTAAIKSGVKYWVVMKAAIEANSLVADDYISVEIATLSDLADPSLGIIESKALTYDHTKQTSSTYAYSVATVNQDAGSDPSGLTDAAPLANLDASDATPDSTVSIALYVFLYPLTFWDLQGDPDCGADFACSYVDFFYMSSGPESEYRQTLKMKATRSGGFTGGSVTISVTVNRRSEGHYGFQPLIPFYGALLVEGDDIANNKARWYGVDMEKSDRVQWKRDGPLATIATYRWTDGNNGKRYADQTNTLFVKVKMGTALYGSINPTTYYSYLFIALPDWGVGNDRHYFERVTGDPVKVTDTPAEPVHLLKYSSLAGDIYTEPTQYSMLEGSWEAPPNPPYTESVCAVKLAEGQMIPAGSTLLLKVIVQNPDTYIKASDPNNVWKVFVASGLSNQDGTPSALVESAKTLFKADDNDMRFSKNVPVLGKMSSSEASVSPIDTFRPGAVGKVQVYFKPIQETGVTTSTDPAAQGRKWGSITLMAPEDFRFTDFTCTSAASVAVGNADPNDRSTWLPALESISCYKNM